LDEQIQIRRLRTGTVKNCTGRIETVLNLL